MADVVLFYDANTRRVASIHHGSDPGQRPGFQRLVVDEERLPEPDDRPGESPILYYRPSRGGLYYEYRKQERDFAQDLTWDEREEMRRLYRKFKKNERKPAEQGDVADALAILYRVLAQEDIER